MARGIVVQNPLVLLDRRAALRDPEL